MHKLILFAALPFLIAAAPDDAKVAALRDAALEDDLAFAITEGLTTEVGPRLAGTEAEARARDWAVKRLKGLGFKNVHVEPFDMPMWVRGEERAEIVSPYPQRLVLAALGNSGATPAEGIEADIAAFATVADLEGAADAQVRGKIVFVGHSMRPTQDGSSYGFFGPVRRTAPATASRKGAAAIVIRSLGTDSHRNPHAGGTSFADGATPIPAAALSNPDADTLERIVAQGKPVRLRLVLTPRQIGTRQSGNVVAEVPGTDPTAGIVLIGGHLDSWDLGTGAIDDASGVAITTAAAKRIMESGRPRRTIRVVWFGAEEVGVFGGNAYFARNAGDDHVLAAESDFGADRIWRFDVRLNAAAQPVADRLERVLGPLGIARGSAAATGGADVGPVVRAGTPGVDLKQDGTRYFDLHHTPDDTLDKVDPEQLCQNVAAWTAMLAVVANAPEALGKGE